MSLMAQFYVYTLVFFSILVFCYLWHWCSKTSRCMRGSTSQSGRWINVCSQWEKNWNRMLPGWMPALVNCWMDISESFSTNYELVIFIFFDEFFWSLYKNFHWNISSVPEVVAADLGKGDTGVSRKTKSFQIIYVPNSIDQVVQSLARCQHVFGKQGSGHLWVSIINKLTIWSPLRDNCYYKKRKLGLLRFEKKSSIG